MLYLVYINLTPGLTNQYSSTAHHPVINLLRKHFGDWTGFSNKYPDHSLGLTVATKQGVTELNVMGPSVSKKSKSVDFSIFIPQDINTMKIYLDNVFEGINLILKKYNVTKTDAFKKDVELVYNTLVL